MEKASGRKNRGWTRTCRDGKGTKEGSDSKELGTGHQPNNDDNKPPEGGSPGETGFKEGQFFQ